MCKLPPGAFKMGPAEGEPTAHAVRVTKKLLIDQYEATQAQVARFALAHGNDCGEKPCNLEIPNITQRELRIPDGEAQFPSLGMSFDGAKAYCAWVGKRLPTEAEWELAARHDPITGRDRTYPWGDTFEPGIANVFGAIERVGAFTGDRSAIGVRDLGGGTHEWVLDCYQKARSCEGAACIDPLVEDHCEKVCEEGPSHLCDVGRTMKGATFASPPEHAKAALRIGWAADSGGGVRCVLEESAPR